VIPLKKETSTQQHWVLRSEESVIVERIEKDAKCVLDLPSSGAIGFDIVSNSRNVEVYVGDARTYLKTVRGSPIETSDSEDGAPRFRIRYASSSSSSNDRKKRVRQIKLLSVKMPRRSRDAPPKTTTLFMDSFLLDASGSSADTKTTAKTSSSLETGGTGFAQLLQIATMIEGRIMRRMQAGFDRVEARLSKIESRVRALEKGKSP